MDRAKETEARLVELVGLALDAATGLEELIDCAQAAAALRDPALVERVAARLADEIDDAAASAGAWYAELTYSSKVDAWSQTGHRARQLAEAWGTIAPLLASKPKRSSG